MPKTVFSGIQPSGQLHIGNYYGAIRSWLDLQANKNYECIFAIVDYHALTEGPDPKELERRVFETAVDFLAAGLDPAKSTIMLQSFVPEHTDLSWILNCITPISWLERVPTFKDKIQQHSTNINMGLMDYPVLMTADILIYNADIVPVGQDQLTHLELAREIARSFNSRYGKTFKEPHAMVTPTPKIMSLTDPTKKMSKSFGEKAYLALADGPDVITKKIKSAVTATGNETKVMQRFLARNNEIQSEFGKTKPHKLEIRTEQDLFMIKKELGDKNYAAYMAYFNLYMLLYLFAEKGHRKLFVEDLSKGEVRFSTYKEILIKSIIANPELTAFREKRAKLIKNPKKVEDILKTGSARARRKAQKNLLLVKKKIGLA